MLRLQRPFEFLKGAEADTCSLRGFLVCLRARLRLDLRRPLGFGDAERGEGGAEGGEGGIVGGEVLFVEVEDDMVVTDLRCSTYMVYSSPVATLTSRDVRSILLLHPL